ncbi:hypothetical protein HK099_007174, partial [Clydaea vesicula]
MRINPVSADAKFDLIYDLNSLRWTQVVKRSYSKSTKGKSISTKKKEGKKGEKKPKKSYNNSIKKNTKKQNFKDLLSEKFENFKKNLSMNLNNLTLDN